MVTRCLFGLFVFSTNSSIMYRLLTDDLLEDLKQHFRIRGYKFNDNPKENNQVKIVCFF